MVPLLLLILGAIFIPGLVNKTRALLSGRRGVRFFQPLRTVSVLMCKGTIYSNSSTFLTRLAPTIYLAVVLTALLMIPLGSFPALISFSGDFILFCYLLALGKLMLVFAALESGSSFQGMGAAREVLFSMLIEPCFFMIMGTFALVTGYTSMTDIFAGFDNLTFDLLVLSVILGYAFFNISLAENGRVPVDDTRTHLELTMVHEAMVLDLSGIDLAYIQMTGWLKLSIYGLFVGNVLIPSSSGFWDQIGYVAIAMVVYSIAIGIIESLIARNRMSKNMTYLATVSAIGLLGFVIAFVLMHHII